MATTISKLDCYNVDFDWFDATYNQISKLINKIVLEMLEMEF